MRLIFLTLTLFLLGCEKQPVSPDRTVGVEATLDDSLIPGVGDVRVIVLPSGERVLVMTGSNGIAACYLPPLKAEKP